LEKERFLDLARNYTSLTEAETNDLDALQKQYPYSQVIHNLASRGAQDHKLETSKTLLNISAVYSSDRSVLKNIITAPRTKRSETGVETITTVVIENPFIEKPFPFVRRETDGLSSEELNEEIMHDLNRLQELKHDFEVSVEAFEHSGYSPLQTSQQSPQSQPSPQKEKKPAQKKKEEPLDLIPEPSGEGLLEEIKTTKKKIAPESPRQKEQIEIIDQFIKKQPSLAKNASSAGDASDLAEKNLSLIDNIVSETLVEILLRQGKKDKAVEVLKKLIWKFPQKKAIFAAQIDELKK